jgi:ribosomal protein S7
VAKSVFVNQNSKVNLKKSISNHLLLHGKKSKCEAFFLKAVKLIQKSSIKSSQLIVKSSIVNSLTIINVKKLIKKKGKQKFIQEIPFILSKNKRISLSIKRALSAVIKNKLLTISKFLQIECILNSKTCIKKTKDSTEQEFLAKKKYAKFRWFL